MSKAVKDEIRYKIGNMNFIVTPVYKEAGETIYDILLKLVMADLNLE